MMEHMNKVEQERLIASYEAALAESQKCRKVLESSQAHVAELLAANRDQAARLAKLEKEYQLLIEHHKVHHQESGGYSEGDA